MRITLSLRAFLLWCAVTAMLPLAVVAGVLDPAAQAPSESLSPPSVSDNQVRRDPPPIQTSAPPAVSAGRSPCASANPAADGEVTFTVYFNRDAGGPRPDIATVIREVAACATLLPPEQRRVTVRAFADVIGTPVRNDALIAERVATLRSLLQDAGYTAAPEFSAAPCVEDCYCKGAPSIRTTGSPENAACRRGEITLGER